MIVDAHLDIAWNALAEGLPFDGQPAAGRLVSRDSLTAAGVGLVFATIYTAPATRLGDMPPARAAYRTPGEAHLMGRLEIGYYHSVGLQLLTSSEDIRRYRRAWKPGRIAAVLLMENADPIESPAQVGDWVKLGVRIIGPAWTRTRYCGGTHAPGGLTDAGRRLLRAMARHHLVLDLSHMADRSVADSLEMWKGPLVATHAGARALNNGQRQLPDEVITEIGRRDGIFGVSFYSGHLRANGRARVADIVHHAVHVARVTGDPRHLGIGSDLDGGFGKERAALRDLSEFAALRVALRRHFSAADVDGIMGANWLRFLERALP